MKSLLWVLKDSFFHLILCSVEHLDSVHFTVSSLCRFLCWSVSCFPSLHRFYLLRPRLLFSVVWHLRGYRKKKKKSGKTKSRRIKRPRGVWGFVWTTTASTSRQKEENEDGKLPHHQDLSEDRSWVASSHSSFSSTVSLIIKNCLPDACLLTLFLLLTSFLEIPLFDV